MGRAIIVLLLLPLAAEAGDGWQASWIWLRAGPPDPRNAYVHVRGTFDLDTETLPERVRCLITAEGAYKLWLNGRYVGRGPAKGTAKSQYYDRYTIDSFLRRGRNVVAALVFNYGLDTLSYRRRGKAGFICEVRAPAPGGGSTEPSAVPDAPTRPADTWSVLAATDSTWRLRRSTVWDPEAPQLTREIGPAEWVDLRRRVEGWQDVDFDDSAWETARALGRPPLDPWDLKPRQIPMLREDRVFRPISFVEGGTYSPGEPLEPDAFKDYLFNNVKGYAPDPSRFPRRDPLSWDRPIVFPARQEHQYAVLDLGREVAGFVGIDVDGPPGASVEVVHAEGLSKVLFREGQVHGHYDRVTLPGGPATFETYHPRAMRFIQLQVGPAPAAVRISRLTVREFSYLVDEVGFFACSDGALQRLWEMGKETVRLCMFDTYVDCPYREQAQWWGDVRVSAMANYYAFGDHDLASQALRQLGETQADTGLFEVFYPSGRLSWRWPSYSFLWGNALREYFLYTGDRSVPVEMMGALRRLLAYGKRNVSGLLEGTAGFTDHGYGGGQACLNAFFYRALTDGMEVMRLLNDRDGLEEYEAASERIRNAFNDRFFSEEEGTYVDPPEKGRPLFVNALALYAGLVPEERSQGVVGAVLAGKGELSPYFTYYVMEGLCRYGHHREVLDIIRLRYGAMVESGGTTLWEASDPTFAWRPSLCHGWSGAPSIFLQREVLGVRPTRPGFEEVTIEPRLLGLRLASGGVPSPRGVIWVRIEREGREQDEQEEQEQEILTLKVDLPDGVLGVLGFPRFEGLGEIYAGGDVIWRGKPVEHPAIQWWRTGEEFIFFRAGGPGLYVLTNR